jgi:hypothetical protein
MLIQGIESAITSTLGDTDDETDVAMLARALFALIWDAGRLVLAEPDTFPAERILAFAEKVGTRLQIAT